MFTPRELVVIELGLINRKEFWSRNLGVVPGAEDKLQETEELLKKIRKG